MPEASLHVRWVVVALSVLLGKVAEHLDDVTLQVSVERSPAPQGLGVPFEDGESDVENRSLSDVPTKGIKDRLVGSAWTLWHSGVVPMLLADAQDTASVADLPAGAGVLCVCAILMNRTYHRGIFAPGATFITHSENGKGLQSGWYAETLSRRIREIGDVRDRITFIEGDAMEAMREFRKQLRAAFLIDPPYTVAGKRAGSRLYLHHDLDHERLFEVAASLAGEVLMTYDDASDVALMAARRGFEVERIAMMNTHHAKMTELLIGKDVGWV